MTRIIYTLGSLVGQSVIDHIPGQNSSPCPSLSGNRRCGTSKSAGRNPMCPNDESPGGGNRDIEKVSGHQGWNCLGGMIQHMDIPSIDPMGGICATVPGYIQRSQRDFIVHAGMAQRAEKRVPLSDECDVPFRTRQQCIRNTPDRLTKEEHADSCHIGVTIKPKKGWPSVNSDHPRQ
jgi:hypothetical protein